MKEYKNKYRVATNGEEFCIEVYEENFFFPFTRRFDYWTFFPCTFADMPYFSSYDLAKKECDRLEAQSLLRWKRENLEWRAVEK